VLAHQRPPERLRAESAPVAKSSRTPAAALRLSATSAQAVDPEAAWAQYAAGDSSMLASIAPGLAVLTPGAGNEDWQALQHTHGAAGGGSAGHCIWAQGARDGHGASARDARCVQGKLAVGHLEGDLGVSIAAPAPLLPPADTAAPEPTDRPALVWALVQNGTLTSVHLSGCGQSQLQSQSHHVRLRRRCGCPRRAPKPLTLRPRGPSTLLATAACSRPSRRGSRCSRPGKRVLIMDEVDDTRTTLKYCVEEVRLSFFLSLGVRPRGYV
jgi:hypothetical protein